jgi:hypothetical protein
MCQTIVAEAQKTEMHLSGTPPPPAILILKGKGEFLRQK